MIEATKPHDRELCLSKCKTEELYDQVLRFQSFSFPKVIRIYWLVDPNRHSSVKTIQMHRLFYVVTLYKPFSRTVAKTCMRQVPKRSEYRLSPYTYQRQNIFELALTVKEKQKKKKERKKKQKKKKRKTGNISFKLYHFENSKTD